MAQTRKKKPIKKPSYTKLNGYRFVNDIVRRVPKLLQQAADVVVNFEQLGEGVLSTGEILQGKDAIKRILEKAPGIRKGYDDLEVKFKALVATPGKKDEEHFADLVGEGSEFLAAMTEDIIGPMAEIADIIEKRTAKKDTVNV